MIGLDLITDALSSHRVLTIDPRTLIPIKKAAPVPGAASSVMIDAHHLGMPVRNLSWPASPIDFSDSMTYGAVIISVSKVRPALEQRARPVNVAPVSTTIAASDRMFPWKTE